MFFCGQRWIRTTEGVSQQIYSLPHLATLVFALFAFAMAKVGIKAENTKGFRDFISFSPRKNRFSSKNVGKIGLRMSFITRKTGRIAPS